VKINITFYSDKDWKVSILKLNKDYNYKYIKSMKKILSVVSICSAVGATLLPVVSNSLETTLVSIGLMWTAIMSTKELAEYGRN
jgi:hypothetical protein